MCQHTAENEIAHSDVGSKSPSLAQAAVPLVHKRTSCSRQFEQKQKAKLLLKGMRSHGDCLKIFTQR